jgi:hypothetical protein
LINFDDCISALALPSNRRACNPFAHLRKLSAHGGKFTLNVDGWQIGDEEHECDRVTAD